MPVSREQALQLLGLEASVTPVGVEQALLERVTQLEARIAAAPTDALKDKYRRQLAELEEARTTLLAGPSVATGLSHTKMADLPLAQAAYSRDGEAAAGGLGIALQVGAVVAGRYQIAEQIGAGGMGAVFRVHDRNRDKDIAIKVLLPSLLSSPKARERFLNEARLSSEMSHPNIVTVFDVQQDGPHCFLTMELLQGQSLRGRLQQLKQRREPMPLDEALKIADDVCRGLAYAHERTVHRDIKPENLWLSTDGKAKVMDFGIARLLEERDTGLTGTAVGTAYYMPPEQLNGSAQIDGRADQYAVAASLYEMLSGQVPTGRIEPLRKVRADVPASVSNAVDQALSARAGERFADIEAFRTALLPSRSNAVRANGKLIASGAAAAVLLLLALFAWPALKAMLPDREAEARLRVDAARLQGEARSLMRLVEGQRQELRDAAAMATRDAERLDASARSARTPDERAPLLQDALAAQETAAATAEVERRYRAQIDAADGLPSIEGKLNVAEAALKAGDQAQAGSMFKAAVDALVALRAAPAQQRQQIADARTRTLGDLEGRWALAACEAASSWALRNGNLQIQWPGNTLYEARVVQVVGPTVGVVVLTPASQKGHLYRYSRNGNRLEVEDLTEGRRASLARCP